MLLREKGRATCGLQVEEMVCHVVRILGRARVNLVDAVLLAKRVVPVVDMSRDAGGAGRKAIKVLRANMLEW